MDKSPFSGIAFFFIVIAFINGGFGAAIPFAIFFFIANTIMGGGKRKQRSSRPRGRQENDRSRARKEADLARQRSEARRREEIRRRQSKATRPAAPRKNPLKNSGLAKFKEYDYDGAIEDFQKALTISPDDIAIHFNLSAAYSLTENKESSFFHLDRAVRLGFKDFDKINTHDALAYLRIQPEFDDFKQNGYRVKAGTIKKKNPGLDAGLLEQLNRLQDLRERGVLTEAEFETQKGKLLR